MNIKLFELKIIHFRGIITLVMISVFTIVIVEVLNYVKYIVLLLYIIRVIKFYLFEKGILIKKKKVMLGAIQLEKRKSYKNRFNKLSRKFKLNNYF